MTESPGKNHNQFEYSVSEISAALKRVVEDSFGYVRVRGEISGFKIAASGHVYLALKDDKSVLDGVMWRGNAARLNFKPEDGLEIIASGKISTYGGRSKYQIIIDRMEPAGIGALMALLEKRKRQLAAEGLFDQSRKQTRPFLPQVIGVVTSPTGAVIRDILHRIEDRFPCHLLLWPVLVQGEGAAEQIAAAIAGFNALPSPAKDSKSPPRPDLIIVARGGGSLEDLWAFNEEIVVRAAADSAIPLISAVGHETDTTLIDYASDLRAPTPSAAAELAVPRRGDLLVTLDEYHHRLRQAMRQNLQHSEERLTGLARGLPHPESLLQQATQKLDELAERLALALPRLIQQKTERLYHIALSLQPQILLRELKRYMRDLENMFCRLLRVVDMRIGKCEQQLEMAAKLLESLNYRRVLERGFVLVRDSKSRLKTSAAGIKNAQELSLTFHDGEVMVTAGSGKKQGELF